MENAKEGCDDNKVIYETVMLLLVIVPITLLIQYRHFRLLCSCVAVITNTGALIKQWLSEPHQHYK